MVRTEPQTIQALTAKREAALSAMSEELRAVFADIETRLDDLKSQNIRQYHIIGKMLNDVSTRPDDYRTLNGASGVSVLSKALDMDKRTLRCAAQFYNFYTQEQLEALLDLRNEHTNFRLNFGHVRYLMTVIDTEARTAYGVEAVAQSLSPQDLHDMIKRREGREPAHGRAHTLPRSLTAQLQQICKFARTFVSKQENVWNGQSVSVFTNIDNAAASEIDAEHVAIIEEIRDLMVRIGEYSVANVRRCEEIKTVVEQKLNEEETRITTETAAAATATANRTRRSRSISMQGANA